MIEVQNQIIREMADLHDWFDKYEYMIQLGNSIPDLDPKFKTEQNHIPGCQSSVWIHTEKHDGKLRFFTDCDSRIIKGMLALLLRIYDNRSPEEISSADLFFIRETGLDKRLSPSRANSFQLLINQFQYIANSQIT